MDAGVGAEHRLGELGRGMFSVEEAQRAASMPALNTATTKPPRPYISISVNVFLDQQIDRDEAANTAALLEGVAAFKSNLAKSAGLQRSMPITTITASLSRFAGSVGVIIGLSTDVGLLE